MDRKSLQISLLGGARIEQDGTAVTGFASRKAEALFIYLACQQRPIPRETLAALLWPENDQTRALANLSVVLSSLRKQLDDYLLADRHTISFNLAADFRLDVAEFEQAINEARTQQQKSGKVGRTSAAQLATAVTFYQGGFLAGFNVRNTADFEAWVLLEQEHLRQMMLAALSDLITFHLQRRQYAQGIAYALQLVAQDPLLEDAHRQLMQLYAQNDQRTQALVQYEQCCRILADELGVEPDEATTALFNEIQAGERQPEISWSSGVGEISTLLPRPPAPLHNLPAPTNTFIGREVELARIETWLADGNGRLLTLIGPGGIGKTRLAQEAARSCIGEFLDGVWYVSLVPLQDAAGIVPVIAETLGYSFAGTADPQSELLAYLRGREMLLILDNFEHILGSVGLDFISRLLAQSPEIKLLATSRERLNIQAEQLLELRGLPYPLNSNQLMVNDHSINDFPSVQLFASRAQRLRADFVLNGKETAVTQLCRLVDGLPLALELAATWIRTLTLPEIVAEIERGLDFLAAAVRDMPERHHSLRAVFDTSWQMLTEPERRAVQQLSVFRGGFTRQAAQAVADAPLPLLAALVDKSFMRLDEDGRYRRHTLLIQFAAEKLAAKLDLEAQTRRRHAEYYGRFCHELESYLLGAQPEVGITRLAPEQDNVRQAWHWAADNRDAALLNQMADTIMQGFDLLGLYLDEREMAERAVKALSGSDAADVDAVLAWGRSLGLMGGVDFRLGNYEHSVAESEESIEILTAVRPHIAYAHSYVYLGAGRFGLGQFEQACADWETAVAAYEAVGSQWGQTVCLGNLAEARFMLGDFVAAQSYAKRAYRIARQLNNAEQMGSGLISLAKVALQEKRLEDASSYGQQALDLFRQTGHKAHIANALAILGSTAQQRGQRDVAHRFFSESVTMQRQAGNQLYLVSRLMEWGQAALALADLAEAETILAGALREAYLSQMTPFALNVLACLADLSQRWQRSALAVQMAAFVTGHDAAVPEAIQTAEAVLQAAEVHLPAEQFQQAQVNGRAADISDFLSHLF